MEQNEKSAPTVVEKEVKVTMPKLEELLEAGVQFGHETQRWHPKMQKFIFGSKNNIHIINASETLNALEKVSAFVVERAALGNLMFVGTKRQSSRIIKDAAIKCGAYFVDQRWAGGLLTNFAEVKKSLHRLNSLEKSFEEGVQDRTKYEVNLMKKEWQKLNRLYSGIKTMESSPTAVVVIDAKFERSALREAKKLRIPVIAVVDTNTNPDLVDYIIPANDDAIKSISIIMNTIADAALLGNKGKGVDHKLRDYSKYEVEITKTAAELKLDEEESFATVPETTESGVRKIRKVSTTKSVKGGESKGILERVQETREKKAK